VEKGRIHILKKEIIMSASLVVIGDSLSQGVQSGAISKTDQSYPFLIADALGAPAFRVPDFHGAGGMPINLENLFRMLSQRYGEKISWYELLQAGLSVHSFLDRLEDYWERGEGTKASDTGPMHHNLAVWGFELVDCDTLSERTCKISMPTPQDHILPWNEIPEFAMYRTARRTLNPSFHPDCSNLTQIQLAKKIADEEGGIDNLIVFLGANNCLGTSTSLNIQWSDEVDLNRLAHQRTCTLWKEEHFKRLYEGIAPKIDDVGANHVLVGTVPHVTILPVIRGVSTDRSPFGKQDDEGYFEYYTYFWVWDEDFQKNPDGFPYLSRAEARTIDDTIDSYNKTITEEARVRGWHVVDTCSMLDQMAFRRQRGNTQYAFPAGLVEAIKNNPDTRHRYIDDDRIILDTRYLHEDTTQAEPISRYQGGIFSLDGIHSTRVGYAVVAHEFIKVMKTAGVHFAKDLDWDAIVRTDLLLTELPANLKNLRDTLGFLSSKTPILKLIRALGSAFD